MEEPKFGPPLYDESKWAYRRRHFSKGFTYGGLIAFALTSQFAALQNFLSPNKVSPRELAMVPFAWTAIIGFGVGCYYVYDKTYVVHKPALSRIKENS